MFQIRLENHIHSQAEHERIASLSQSATNSSHVLEIGSDRDGGRPGISIIRFQDLRIARTK
jgi:hypothetical protein